MTTLEHDGAAALRVEYRNSTGNNHGEGWRVVRRCLCHEDEPITVPFDTPEEAEHVRQVLDRDARRHAGAGG